MRGQPDEFWQGCLVTRTWTEWTAALAWGEALTDWYRATHPNRWTDDHRTDLAHTMMLLGVAIQAAARLSERTVTTSPDDLGRVRLALVTGLVDAAVTRTVLLHVDGIGPTGDEPGAGTQRAGLLQAAQVDSLWQALVDRASEVLRAHAAEIAPEDAYASGHVLADRRDAVQSAARWLYDTD